MLPDGTSDRSGAVVVKKKLTQWYFKITDYADRLLDDLNQLEGRWPSKVIAMQRNWIGRSVGADVDFVIEGRDEPVTVFTTRPDTIHGVTFLVVAPTPTWPPSSSTTRPSTTPPAPPSRSTWSPRRRRRTSTGRTPTARRPACRSAGPRCTR